MLYEDDCLLVINKQAGVVVSTADSVIDTTIEDYLMGLSPFSGLERAGIVHRLDRDTSGLLIIAKSEEIKLKLQALFYERKIRKTYLALVHGSIEPDTGEIEAPIVRNPKNRHKFTVGAGGRDSSTNFEVIERYSLPVFEMLSERSNITKKEVKYYEDHAKYYSYVRLFPKTGRTHQIRVHMQYIRHPLVSDTVYLNKKLYRLDKIWCQRHFLHASEVRFSHPKSGKNIEIICPLPSDLESALSLLKSIS